MWMKAFLQLSPNDEEGMLLKEPNEQDLTNEQFTLAKNYQRINPSGLLSV